MYELKTQDLQLCTDMVTGVDSLGQYQFGDMVQIKAQTVGVIVNESFKVLNIHGKEEPTKPAALQKKRVKKNVATLNSEQNAIQSEDIVKCIDGPHSGRQVWLGGVAGYVCRGRPGICSVTMLSAQQDDAG